MTDIKVINARPEDTSEISCTSTSSGSETPLIPHERSRLLVTFVVVMGLIFIWGIALLPAIFYANKLPAPPEHHINMRYEFIMFLRENIAIFMVFPFASYNARGLVCKGIPLNSSLLQVSSFSCQLSVICKFLLVGF